MAALGPREQIAFHRGTNLDGQPLTAKDRENMVKPFLPPTPSTATPSPTSSPSPAVRKPTKKSHKPKSMRSFLASQLHLLVYTIVHTIFSVWFRFRRAWHAVAHRFFALLYYHHRTPEYIQKDVKNLGKLPDHLSVILELNESDDEQGNAGLEGLINDACEIAAWCACAGIPLLSIYERTGKPMASQHYFVCGSVILLRIY